ncbi:MAG: molecular chaperone, partial [Mycobacterium sp.]|nr:molecular chaperone [Mycobacterium sp.]
MNPVDPPVLGLSIGTTNLVAVRSGRTPVTRRSVLTLWGNRPAEVGVPTQNPELTSPNLTQAGSVLRGFVERVGDPTPLVAADGSAHRSEIVLAAALEAMARAAGEGQAFARVVVAAPAHWGPATVGALRSALGTSALLGPGGVSRIVADSTAALTALRAAPGLPASGVVALCDFGGSGSSITLADAGAGLAPIGQTVRVRDFGGDLIDQAVLNHVLSGIGAGGHDDPGSTSAVGSLTRLREESRLAKERLSTDIATVVPVDLPGYRPDIRLTRPELEALIAEPFAAFLNALGDALENNRIPAASLTAVAVVGGTAAIPAITQRLSESLRVPVITNPDPGCAAAAGAALLAAREDAPDAPTAVASRAADAATTVAPTAWSVGAAGQTATEPAAAGVPSATHRALAWSQSEPAEEPVPYAGDDYYGAETGVPPGAGQMVEFEPADVMPDELAAALPWYRRPPILFGVAAALAAVAVGGLAITLTGNDSTPTTTTTRVTKPGESPSSSGPPPVPVTTTVTGGNGQTTVTTVTPTTTTPPTTTPTTTTSTPT